MQKKPTNKAVKKDKFKIGDFAIYPSHGVGKVMEIESTKIGGQKFDLMAMYFEKEKLNIKIPVDQVEKIGIRPLVSKEQMNEVLGILRSGVKKLKGMWSRRAQEYESKINSGDIKLLAEVLRDLTRDIEDGDRSYSERIIYETAIYRLAGEYSVVYNIAFEKAKEEITAMAKNKLGSQTKDKEEIAIKKDDFDDEFDLEEEAEENEDDDDENESNDDDLANAKFPENAKERVR